jgi:hypothetical protein
LHQNSPWWNKISGSFGVADGGVLQAEQICSMMVFYEKQLYGGLINGKNNHQIF